MVVSVVPALILVFYLSNCDLRELVGNFIPFFETVVVGFSVVDCQSSNGLLSYV